MEPNRLERRCLDHVRSGLSFAGGNPADPVAWVEFGLHAALDAAAAIRDLAHAAAMDAELKPDGSPATELEMQIEARIRGDLSVFAPNARMIGEESGGELPESGVTVAVDPIDGTWAFLSQTESYSVCISILQDGEPLAGTVANPATGEVAYHGPRGPARFIRMGFGGQPVQATDLPLRLPDEGKVLVHLHPNPGASALAAGLYRAWKEGSVMMVRSAGGSPAWGIVEAAKGHFTYVNKWHRRAAEPWDLAAAVEIVRRAGGDVVDLQGAPIDTLRHTGPFVAGLSEKGRSVVARVARSALETNR